MTTRQAQANWDRRLDLDDIPARHRVCRHGERRVLRTRLEVAQIDRRAAKFTAVLVQKSIESSLQHCCKAGTRKEGGVSEHDARVSRRLEDQSGVRIERQKQTVRLNAARHLNGLTGTEIELHRLVHEVSHRLSFSDLLGPSSGRSAAFPSRRVCKPLPAWR